MIYKRLSPQAMKIIYDYLHLPLSGHLIRCPYFNNRIQRVRAGLRVLVGKGNTEDIVTELELIAMREKINLSVLSAEAITKLLVETNIGIDCSGFVYHVLDGEFRALSKGGLGHHLFFPFAGHPIRKILSRLRPVENTNVQTLAHDKNTIDISLSEIVPGDLIMAIDHPQFSHPDHVLLVHEVNYDQTGRPTRLFYSHSFRWPSDGQYGHGVRQGQIDITSYNSKIWLQTWIEDGKSGKENHTFRVFQSAKRRLLRRVRHI